MLAHLKAGVQAGLLPDPVTIGRWQQPALPIPRKPLAAIRPVRRDEMAHRPALDRTRRKPLTRRNLTRIGLPSAVVSTAATNGVLPATPRPRLPP